MTQKNLLIKLVSVADIEVNKTQGIRGWGKEAKSLIIEGRIANITIARNGENEFGIRILEDGSLILTNYQGFHTQIVDRSLRLNNTRPWKDQEDETK